MVSFTFVCESMAVVTRARVGHILNFLDLRVYRTLHFSYSEGTIRVVVVFRTEANYLRSLDSKQLPGIINVVIMHHHHRNLHCCCCFADVVVIITI